MAGIYIHIPFCETRCHYCDFFTGTDKSMLNQYVNAICKEIGLRKEYLDGEEIETIYFGGGTPSQLSVANFEKVFKAIYDNLKVVPEVEVTFEANPDDLSNEYLRDLRSQPFNRISIGIQSFNDEELKFLNRRHSAQRAIDAIREAQDLNYNNISLDLMYGLPNQTIETWQRNLDIAISLDVQHISSYHLIYEPGTLLFNMLKNDKIKEVDEELSTTMFSMMIDKLTQADFMHYEISNFARNGLFSKHNSSYWKGVKYLGIGSAAHSFDGVNRALNIASLSKYISAIEAGVPCIEFETLIDREQYNDFILTGMRTMWGVDLNNLETKFGNKMLTYCLQYAEKHIKAETLYIDQNKLKLTKKGIFISDSIMSDLMFVK